MVIMIYISYDVMTHTLDLKHLEKVISMSHNMNVKNQFLI